MIISRLLEKTDKFGSAVDRRRLTRSSFFLNCPMLFSNNSDQQATNRLTLSVTIPVSLCLSPS